MLNLGIITKVYLAVGVTDLWKSIDGLVLEVQNGLKLDPFEKALFVFCNKQQNTIKILNFDEGFGYWKVIKWEQLQNSSPLLRKILTNKTVKSLEYQRFYGFIIVY